MRSFFPVLARIALLGTASAQTLYVTSYPLENQDPIGLTTLNLAGANLQSVQDVNLDCGKYPSWLTLDGDVLYCVDESWPTANGTVSSHKVNADGSLTLLDSAPTVGGPVSTIVYGNKGLAVADYAGGGVNFFNITDPANLVEVQKDVFAVRQPVGTADAQKQSRPHQVILDPTGEFVVAPDLGSDLVRVFKVDKTSLKYTESASLELTRGTGPRHAAFATAGNVTFFYLLNELTNTLFAYRVANTNGSLSFTEIWRDTTPGNNVTAPTGTSAAEINVSPDGKFFTISSRNEKSQKFTLPNGIEIPSDPLHTFSIDQTTGIPKRVQTAPAGGVNPRGFNFNKDGSLVAVGLQSDGRIAVFKRDVTSGLIGDLVAFADVKGQPNYVLFKE